jgi:chorismate mutase/prephenate dehydrogenase
VADIFSLKTPVVPVVREAVASGLRVTSIHPLFGPDAVLLAGRTLLICETGDPAAAREARSFFAPTSLAIRTITLEEHDRAMAVVLGLSHAVNLVFAQALLKTGRSFADLAAVASTTFWKQARTSMEVAAESPGLYHAIQRENRESAKTLPLLLDATREFIDAALAETPDRFVEDMRRARAWFSAVPPRKRPESSRAAR